MKNQNDLKIIESWKTNAAAWISIIKNHEIESRLQVTNHAILNTTVETKAITALDIGCGEGWLVRELEKQNIRTLGIDVTTELIDYAQQNSSGRYKVLAYENLSHDTLNEKFDLIICNFSLLGDQSVNHLFKHAPTLLNKNGSFIIQTIHPIFDRSKNPYKDGWQKGSWKGFNNEFSNPAPWYFRTLETWKALFLNNGFTLKKIIEPINKKTLKPASVIFVGRCNCCD